MAYTKKIDFGGRAFKDVLGFTIAHWGKQPWRIMAIVLLALLSALADVLTYIPHVEDTIWREFRR